MQSVFNTIIPASNRRALSLMVAGFSAVLISGCATSPVSKVGAITQVEYYPTCYEPVQYLRDSDANVTKSVAGGAAIGAVGGALVGALTGSGEHRVRNAAIGAAGGALAGGAVGYYTERQKQITDDNQRIGSYGTDINRRAADIDRSAAYAKAAQTCYQKAFASLLLARKANTLDDSAGRKRLAEIVAGLKESNDLIVAVNGQVSEDLNNYTQAYEKDLQAVGVQRADVVTLASVGPAPVVKASARKKTIAKKKLPSVPKEAIATEKTLQDAAAKRTASQQVATAGQSQVSSMCQNADLGDWAPVPCPNV